jgi:hypothetical protein
LFLRVCSRVPLSGLFEEKAMNRSLAGLISILIVAFVAAQTGVEHACNAGLRTRAFSDLSPVARVLVCRSFGVDISG